MQNQKVKKMCVYQLRNGNYYVSFLTQNGVQKFYGTREEVLNCLILRMKRILHVHEK